jgi:hypothetical protein
MPWTPITRKTAFGVAPSKPHKKQSNLCVTSYMMQRKADSKGGGRPGHPAMLRHNSKLGELCPPTFETYPKLTLYIVNNVDTVSAKKMVVVLDRIEPDCIPRFLD